MFSQRSPPSGLLLYLRANHNRGHGHIGRDNSEQGRSGCLKADDRSHHHRRTADK
jgi:hypothetical protein